MIHDVDTSLRSLIQTALNGNSVEVVFDAPTKEWSSKRNSPTLDVYLYDIREDLRRRSSGFADVRGDDGLVAERVMAPRWFKLSYLVTAWTQRPEDEHRLLSAVLGTLLQHDRFPGDHLKGSLEGVTSLIPMTVALPPPEDRALSDTWSALGGDLKPSLDVVLIAPFDLTRGFDFGPPVLESPRLRVGDEVVPTKRRSKKKVEPEPEPEPEPLVTVAGEQITGGVDPQLGRIVRVSEHPR